MNFSGFTGFINETCEWLMRLAFLNILWVLFTVLGFGIFGWAPATAAMFSVLRNRFFAEEEFSTIHMFRTVYKEEFVKSNVIGLFMVGGSWSLYYSLSTLIYLQSSVMILFGTIFFIFAILFFIVCLFIFPVFSHYQTTFRNYFRYSLMLGLSHLHICLLMVVGLGITYILFTSFPGLMLFYGISLPVTCVVVLSLKVFIKLEEKEQTFSLSGENLEY
ncbi:YesL family protein [Halalkalibacter alkalisediminis]|uniref:YesL family protein n=1 Tax=Halalkalibacter alkalisediminis TaxID=935616 RepID=A0ABV6NJE3_9BACI|nr:DUF624 domain-containing protein [Halalkalibacter alkalisediminis]